MIKPDQNGQKRSNSTKQGGQTVKYLVTKQCFIVFTHQTILVCMSLFAQNNLPYRAHLYPPCAGHVIFATMCFWQSWVRWFCV